MPLQTGLWPVTENYGIYLRSNLKKRPYQIKMNIPGVRGKCFGTYRTIEEARIVRDDICTKYDIVRPI